MASIALPNEHQTPPLTAESTAVHRVLKNQPCNRGTVVLVEDEQHLGEILEFNLTRQGYSVLWAADGLEACRLIGRVKPDLILLDIMLPLLNGWEICRMVRSHQDQRVSRSPIIMLSALGTEEDRLKGYDLGADLYLPKPYSIKEVLHQVARLIEQERTRKQLHQQLDALQRHHELQDKWQQALFHELRNQLTVISGIAEHLTDDPMVAAEYRDQFIGQISSSSQYLGDLAENYLLIRQVEEHPDRLTVESFLLNDLLSEINDLFLSLAEQRSCRLTVSCPPALTLTFPAVGLKLIIANLVENALKYSASGGHVRMTVTSDADRLHIRVDDDGPGIPAAERKWIFDKFYRIPAVATQASGSGLGLYLGRALAQAMGGTLDLDDQDGPGCTFLLSLPRPRATDNLAD